MILVTGGTGLVGTHLLYQLTTGGNKIRALKRPTSSLESVRSVFNFYSTEGDFLFNQIEWVDGDLLDVYSLMDALQGIDKVYHCAAMVSFDPADANSLQKANADGTANLVNACLEIGVQKLCAVSSTAAIGLESKGKTVSESTEWTVSSNNSDYAVSKYLAEREVWRGIAEGLDAVIINPAIILGPGNWHASSLTIFKTIKSGLPFYTNGANGFVDARDVALVLEQLMESSISNERFLLVGENLPFKDVFVMISQAFGKKFNAKLAGPMLTGIAWRFAGLLKMITGKKPVITRYSAAASHRTTTYSAQKIRETIQFKFTGIRASVDNAVNYFESTSMIMP